MSVKEWLKRSQVAVSFHFLDVSEFVLNHVYWLGEILG